MHRVLEAIIFSLCHANLYILLLLLLRWLLSIIIFVVTWTECLFSFFSTTINNTSFSPTGNKIPQLPPPRVQINSWTFRVSVTIKRQCMVLGNYSWIAIRCKMFLPSNTLSTASQTNLYWPCNRHTSTRDNTNTVLTILTDIRTVSTLAKFNPLQGRDVNWLHLAIHV